MNRALNLRALVGCLVIATIGLWLSFPYLAELALEQWLYHQGYEDPSIRIAYPSWRSLTIQKVNLSRHMQGEEAVIHIRNAAIDYGFSGLLSGRLDRVSIPEASVVVKKRALPHDDPAEVVEPDTSLINVLTVSDLVQGLPVLPFGELRLGRLAVTREEATGPLRHVSVTGTVRQQEEGLLAELSLRGEDTQSYVLRVTDLATRVLSVQLEDGSQPRKPIAYWRSEADSTSGEIRLRGQIELDVEQLAPFLALLLPVGSQLQEISGRVQASWAGTAPSAAALASVWRDPAAKVEGTVQAQVRLPEVKGIGKELALTTAGKFSGNAAQVRWEINRGRLLSVSVDATRATVLRPFHKELPPGFQPVLVESAAGVSGELFWRESPIRFTVEGPLSLTYGASASPTRFGLVAKQVIGRGSVISGAEGTFHYDGALPAALARMLESKSATANLRGGVQLEDERLQGWLDVSSSVLATAVSTGVFATDQAKFVIVEAVPFKANLRSGDWQVEPCAASLLVPEVRLQEKRVRAEHASLQLQSAQGSRTSWGAKGTATLRGLTVVQPQAGLPATDWTLRVTADHVAVHAEVETRLRALPVVAVAVIQHEWETERGSLHFTTSPVTFERATFRLRQLMTPWRYPFDVTEGTISATLDLAWEPDIQDSLHGPALRLGSGEVTLDGLSAQYRDIPVARLSTTLSVRSEGRDRFVTVRPAVVTIGLVNPGVDVTNLSMSVHGEWDRRESLPVVEIRDVKCDLLGGAVTSQGARIDPSRLPYSFTVLVKQLDLQKVLSLEQQKGLEGSGILDGAIPITVSARGVTVKDGQFESRPPGGVIRYRTSGEAAKAVTQADTSMQLVLQALNNFHYNVLQVGAQYAEDGTLNLKARLEGKNPDLKRSPPIHFNLNVQENIPALLKSLRLVQDIEESVQKKFVRP